MSKKASKRKYWNSDSANSLFLPYSGNGKMVLSGTSKLKRQARNEYALNHKKIRLMQFLFQLLTLALVILFACFMEFMQRFRIPPVVHGIIGGLLIGTLIVSVFFVLPVVFEQYCYKKGWLKASIKSNQKPR